jgi:hypothetical protein
MCNILMIMYENEIWKYEYDRINVMKILLYVKVMAISIVCKMICVLMCVLCEKIENVCNMKIYVCVMCVIMCV